MRYSIGIREEWTLICREQSGDWILIRQHDHGLVAGEFAARFNEADAPAKHRREAVLYAVAHHDRGWIDLDETPFWNDEAKAPYSFLDYPVVPKLNFYRKGLDELEAETPYGALLCSLHYDRLIEASGERGESLDAYQEEERERRSRIHRELEAKSEAAAEDELYYDMRLLQFCDDLSLYLGLHEPGSPKPEEHPWFKDGFGGTEDFSFTSGRPVTAKWQGTTLLLEPYPFKESFEVELPLRRVSAAEARAKGLAAADRSAKEERIRIGIAPGEVPRP
ncbi:DUF3891 family protein [Paenibacillus spiritus]|uniref:DUF3891 family protein n=1 Tax=Paenibacillus spiritus TaxID=2496557 RepID=A0A5J5GJX9_9BACL|nr:DUF3891 family protein [Paenibacillus spiritus]KAA9008586.1 DUF3891 family protein [Paenibacillus spiritus]